MKYILSILLLLPFTSLAQPGYRVFDFIDPSLKYISLSKQLGTSYYFGDLCDGNHCYTNPNLSMGMGATLRLNDYFFTNVMINRYRIESSDEMSGNFSRMKRNLSFRSDNYELSCLVNFEFLNYNTFRYITRKEFPISLFSFTGLGITTNNPKAQYGSRWVELRPLRTEGINYSPVALTIPIGLGVGYRFTENFRMDFTIGYRWTSTDYLDDVSTDYEDPESFDNPIARDLQYRSDEVFYGKPQTTFGPDGPVRGNPKMGDGFLLMQFKGEWKIPKINLSSLGVRQKGGPLGPISNLRRRPATRRTN